MIQSSFNPKTQEFDVVISKSDLQNAFLTYDNYVRLLYDIAYSTYGEFMADRLLLLAKGAQDELQNNS